MQSKGVMGVMVLLAALAASCAKEEAAVHSPPMVLVEEEGVEGALNDSLWVELVPSVVGGPSRNREGSWIVEARWFRFAERPDSIYTFSEMAHLDARGVIGEGTMVSLVRYRFLVEAADYPEAKEKVEERMAAPDWPPRRLYEAMAEADREAG